MRPFSNWLQWNLKGRPLHLIEGLLPMSTRLTAANRRDFESRVVMIRRTLKWNLALSIMLYSGIAMSGASWALRFVGLSDEWIELLTPVAQFFSGFSIFLFAALLVVRRRISQLEADVVAICITGRAKGA